MALIDEVSAGIAASMKAHDQTRLSTLRMLKTALVNRAVERRHELDQADSLQVVSSLVKQRRDSIDQFLKGGRKDLADKEAAEIGILRAIFPPGGSADIERVVEAAISETGASSVKDLRPGHEGRHGYWPEPALTASWSTSCASETGTAAPAVTLPAGGLNSFEGWDCPTA
jgi:uncharacterized protein YqeY